jgi:2-polyprenyl-6-methoxyphenol hydroxylase-like FAD-dependent oxidoreductase
MGEQPLLFPPERTLTSDDLAGAFGSGAAFALEDGWILARAIEHARGSPKALSRALEIFDALRSPYYARMSVKVPSFHFDLLGSKLTQQPGTITSMNRNNELKT